MAPAELRPSPDDKLIHVRHFFRDTRMNMTQNFGDPFLLMVGIDEPLSSVRSRIQSKLALSDDELAKWKIAVVSFGTLPPSLYGNHLPNMATTFLIWQPRRGRRVRGMGTCVRVCVCTTSSA